MFYKDRIPILLYFLILFQVICFSCNKPKSNNSLNIDSGIYFDLSYEDNDQGFINPGSLAKALPKCIDGFKTSVPKLYYSDEDTLIRDSFVIVHYTNMDSNKDIPVYIVDFGKDPKMDSKFSREVLINNRIFANMVFESGKNSRIWICKIGTVLVYINDAKDENIVKVIGSALNWDHINNNFN